MGTHRRGRVFEKEVGLSHGWVSYRNQIRTHTDKKLIVRPEAQIIESGQSNRAIDRRGEKIWKCLEGQGQ